MRKRAKHEKREVVNPSIHPSKGIAVRRDEITLVYIKSKKPYSKGKTIRIKRTTSTIGGVFAHRIEQIGAKIRRCYEFGRNLATKV